MWMVTTALGQGADDAQTDQLHVDVALRGTSDRYRTCQRCAVDTRLNCLPVSDIGGEEVMRRSRTLYVLGIAALSLAVAGSGRSVHARHAPSQPLSAAAIGQVACSGAILPRITRAAIFRAEVVLDRLDISPGIIDGKTSENVGKAIAAFQRSRGLAANGKLDRMTWDKLCESTNAPALITYTTTDDDVRGPFVAQIPRDLEGMPASVSSATGARRSFSRKNSTPARS
jgi:peptidoglycan hydrolase-like protein with peptidoglycan-binding domain